MVSIFKNVEVIFRISPSSAKMRLKIYHIGGGGDGLVFQMPKLKLGHVYYWKFCLWLTNFEPCDWSIVCLYSSTLQTGPRLQNVQVYSSL